MNIAEVVAKMNVYLLNAADVCRKWLEPRLKSLEPSDWWNMIVLPSLSELQQRKVNEKGISTLQGLDLQAALTVARKNIYSFRNIEYYADYYGMKDSISAMFEVRNDWAHPTPEEVTMTMTKTDLSRYIDFMERFGGSRAEINEAKEFRASVEMPNYGNPIRIQEPSSCAEEQSASPAVQSAPVKVLENPFVVGAKVVRKSNPDQVGMIGNIRGSGDSTEYEVMFMDTGFGTYYADQLLLADASPERCNVSIDELKILLTAQQLCSPTNDQLYSLNAARVDFVPYRSEAPSSSVKFSSNRFISERHLCSATSGLGQMISTDSKSSLRACNSRRIRPASRKTTLPYSLMTRELLNGKGRQKGLLDLEEPIHFDLVIIDEAHHIRHSTTGAYQVARYFTDNVDAVVC